MIDVNLEYLSEDSMDSLYQPTAPTPNTNGKTSMCWNPKDKSIYICLSNCCSRIHFRTHGDMNSRGGSVRTVKPISPSSGLFYFEVKILGKGREGNVAIGLAKDSTNVNNFPGYDKHSFAYHGLEGKVFCASKTGKHYGPSFALGDIIGCGVDFTKNSCFYTKNGHNLGIAFNDLPGNLYPIIGLETEGAVVDTNFGQYPFLFDINDLLKEMKFRAKGVIDKYPFPLNDTAYQDLIHKLILTYLVHHGYSDTARAFSSEIGIEFSENNNAIENRKKIGKEIINGNIKEAIDMTNEFYPGVLDSNPKLHFKLKCRQFIEMLIIDTNFLNLQSNCNTLLSLSEPHGVINSSNCKKVDFEMEIDQNEYNNHEGSACSPFFHQLMEYGKELYFYSSDREEAEGDLNRNKHLLKNTFSLLAYTNPQESPLSWLIDNSQREHLSIQLNTAVLKYINLPLKPPLEMAISHLRLLLPFMSEHGIGISSFINLEEYFEN